MPAAAVVADGSDAESALELLRRVRLLELVARRNAAGLLAGDYPTAIRGRGLLFEESRKYVPGDPVRDIEWNVTARLGEPFVKVRLEERQREVTIALDVSPSMHVGFQEKTKLEYAVELAATLAVSAILSGDRLGYVIFADEVLDERPPRPGRQQLFVALRAFLEHTAPWERAVRESDPRAAIHAIERQRRASRVVFLISDFIDHDVPEDLRYVRARHDVSLLHVYDPLEYAADAAIAGEAFSPEGGTPEGGARDWIRPGESGSLAAMHRFLRERCAPYRIACESFSTAVPAGPALERFLHLKRRHRG